MQAMPAVARFELFKVGWLIVVRSVISSTTIRCHDGAEFARFGEIGSGEVIGVPPRCYVVIVGDTT
jgi:hypothetical protein